jgi:hypothetical protein
VCAAANGGIGLILRKPAYRAAKIRRWQQSFANDDKVRSLELGWLGALRQCNFLSNPLEAFNGPGTLRDLVTLRVHNVQPLAKCSSSAPGDTQRLRPALGVAAFAFAVSLVATDCL